MTTSHIFNLNMAAKAAFLAVALLYQGVAGAYNPSIRYFGKDAYGAATQNWDVACNSDRISFFANNDGVLVFDSDKWELLHNHNRTNIRSLWYDAMENAIYAGSTNELGKITMGGEGGALVYTSLLDSLGITTTEIWSIGKVGGQVFFQDDRHIYILGDQGARIFGFDNRIYCSTVIDDSLFIYVSGVGCMKFAGGKFDMIEGAEELRTRRVCAILKTQSGEILFVTRQFGVFRLEDGRLSEERYEFSDRLKASMIYTAAVHGDNIAFGTVTNGIYILNRATGEWYNINTGTGLGNNTVLKVSFDTLGNIWAALDNGIAYINLSAAERRLFGDNDSYGTGYASCIWRGNLYLGTNQGLFVTPHPLRPDSEYRRCNGRIGQVWDLSVKGGALFCCHDTGIYIRYPDGGEQTIQLNGTWKLEAPQDRDDILVGSTYDRFFKLVKGTDGRWKFGGFIEGADNASKAFCFDTDGRLWLAHWVKGLFRLSLDEDFSAVVTDEYFSDRNGFPTSFNNYPNIVDGKVLFSTEGGFYAYDNSIQKAVPVDSLNHRFNFTPIATRLFRMPDGDDFYSSGKIQALGYRNNAGDYRLDSLSVRYLASKRPLGFESTLFMADGKILINTEDGFSIISTEDIKNHRDEKSPLLIRNITAVSGAREKCILENISSHPFGRLSLDAEDNTLRFSFQMVEYRLKDAISYSCMMEGYDPDWSMPGTVCTKEYTRLPFGDHTFRVRAYNALTGQSVETFVDFHIRFPWYLSVWAIILYIIAGCAALYGFYRLILKIYEKKLAEMSLRKEKEMEEQQMKDDLKNKANDLATSTMNLIRKNEELISIQEGLDKAAKMLRSGEKQEKIIECIAQMRDEIDSNIRHDDDWKKFEHNFDIVYDEYLTRLGNTFPELTVSDKKLCAYLKMGLSSKEIAPLLNLTYRSVEMTRYRLRKKLNLTRDQNLIDFLQRF